MGESFGASIAANLASKLAECLIAPILRQFGYVLRYKNYVEALENGVKELEIERERVQHSVREAENDGKPIETSIRNWLESVEEEIEKARNLLNCRENAKDACFGGWLPNPLVRHPIARKVKKITKAIQGLHEKSRDDNFQKVYYENTPSGIVKATTSLARSVHRKEDVLESRASIIKHVIKALADDNVCAIGVHGLGGVGKTKLMEDLERLVKEEQLFDEVASTNVSRDPDPKRIQGEIAEALGLKLVNDETVRGRAARLCKRLEQDPKKKILIILDNLWTKLELKEVGIPCGDCNKVRGCKLLLTSRYRDVLYADMGSDREFQLSKLDHGEARILFERIVEDKVNDPQFKSLVDGVVEKCGGLPLLILSVAKRLKRGGLAEWRNALTSIEGSSVTSIVELSYNYLKDERIKSLFLICALHFRRPHMRNILLSSMGLGLYNTIGGTMEKARDGLITDLHRLIDSSLLLGSHDPEGFNMHDLFVDAALSMHDKFIDTEWNALVRRQGFGFEEWSKYDRRKCTAMAFNYDDIDELPNKLDCPDMRILLLFGSNRFHKMSESFFECMEKLQVLNLTGFSFTSLPSSMERLGNIKSLYLDDCHLEDVTILGKLKGLQFLSFVNATIARLPKEIGGLTKLRFLDLTWCTKLKVIEPGVLGSLVNLEELYMQNSFYQWEAEDEASRSNASLAEFKNMHKLSTLHINIPHPATLPTGLPFGKLNRHRIQIGDASGRWNEYKESRTLNLKMDFGNLLVEEWMQRCLEMTGDLYLEILQGGNQSIHNLCFEGFQELKHLHVRNSSSFQDVAHSTGNVQRTAFAKLESLIVENLTNLKKICCGCLAPESFSKLKIVKVDECDEITHLFPMSMLKILSQLEELEISNCHLMQQVVRDAEENEIIDDPIMTSCNLRRLTLRNLPKMTSFSNIVSNSIVFFDEQQVSFPWLESLTLAELPKLKEIWNSQYPSEVSNLKFLEVEGCTSLSGIISSNLLIKLQHLEAITIEKCQSIREVFNLEELTPSENVEILGRLMRLTLNGLPRLEHIWNKNPRGALCFQNLRALRVQNCENLRFLFSSSMAKALVQIKEIEVVSCVLMEEIMDMQEEESEEVRTTDTLEFPMLNSLSLLELPNLKTFSHGEYYIHCPSLTKLTISNCPKMMTFASFEGRQQSTTSSTGLQQAFDPMNSSLSLPSFFNEKVFFPKLEELKLSSMCQLKRIWHDQLHNQSFCKLAFLIVEFCENLSNVFPSNSLDRMQSLNTTEVVGCPSLEALFEPMPLSSEKRQKPLVFNALKKMKLLNLPRLTSILKSHCKVTLAFPSLREVHVRHCHSLPYLFSSATAKNLDQLADLDVSYCNNLRCIIAIEEGEGTTVETLKFQQLGKLKLGDLENLISFCSVTCANDLRPLFDEKLAFPKLEKLHIKGAKQKDLWNDKILLESFCRLKILKVKQCHNLINVIPSFMWNRLLHCLESLIIQKCLRLRNLVTISMTKNLGQLRHLSLAGCGEMEYIVAREEEEKLEEATDKILISHLVTMYLHNMPKLKSFYQGNHISEWPSLKEFTIGNCTAVEVILGDANCRKLGSSVPIQQPLLLVKKVEFPNLKSMKISHMDNMKKIWLDDLASNAFSKLERLVVKHCKKLSSIFSSQTILTRFQNLEVLTVTDCESLEVVFHSQEFNISEAHSVRVLQLRILSLIRLPKMKHVWTGLAQGGLTFSHLECMEAVECESLKSLLPSLVAKSMTRLKELVVQSCGVEEIIAEEDGVGSSTSDLFFPKLSKLTLHELPKLKSFFGYSHTPRWPFLEYLQVTHCGKIRSFSFPCEIQSCQDTAVNENQPALFPFKKVMPRLRESTLTREDVVMMPQHYTFANLTQLTLSCYHDETVDFPSDFLLLRFPTLHTLYLECSSFEEIFPEDASGHGGATPCAGLTNVDKPLPALRNLHSLSLRRLCNLRRVWKDGSLMTEVLNQIQELVVWECPSLSVLFPSPTSFQRLTYLNVEDCVGLVHVVTCSAATSLVHLTWLTLKNCEAMEDVVTDDENGAEEISFPGLYSLTLDGLPSLESFSPANCAFRFPSLGSITVKQCPKLNIFCKGALRTPKLRSVELSSDNDYEERWKGDLNTTIQTLLT